MLIVGVKEVVFERGIVGIVVEVEKQADDKKGDKGYADGVDNAMGWDKFILGVQYRPFHLQFSCPLPLHILVLLPRADEL